MTEAEICKLCKDNLAIEIDLEKPKFKSANKLLQRLFDWYKIDVSSESESNGCQMQRNPRILGCYPGGKLLHLRALLWRDFAHKRIPGEVGHGPGRVSPEAHRNRRLHCISDQVGGDIKQRRGRNGKE